MDNHNSQSLPPIQIVYQYYYRVTFSKSDQKEPAGAEESNLFHGQS